MSATTLSPSTRSLSRVGGSIWLVIIAFGVFGESFVRGRLIAWGDPSATAHRILASEGLWRFSVAAELLYLLGAVALAAILWILLRPAGRDLAALAVFFDLVSIAVEAVGRLQLTSALTTLRSREALAAFTSEQVDALAYLSIQAHGRGFSISLLFFGCFCLAIGWLIVRSGYVPTLLGALMMLAGLGYLLDGFSLLLSPSFHALVFPFSLLPAFVGELALALWLLVRGVGSLPGSAAGSTLGGP